MRSALPLLVAVVLGNVASAIEDIDGDAHPDAFVAVGDVVFFTASDGERGTELWRTDGTRETTRSVADVFPGEVGGVWPDLGVLGGRVYFAGADGVGGCGLWRSEGSSADTALVHLFRPGRTCWNGRSFVGPGDFAALGRRLFFSADDGVHGRELWVTDGSPGGTRMVKNLDSTPDGSGEWGSEPRFMTPLGSTLIFAIRKPSSGVPELWRSDGTEAGTLLLAVVDAVPAAGQEGRFAALDDVVLFAASSRSGRQLWRSDGTAAGTGLIADRAPRGDRVSGHSAMAAWRGRVYFVADADGGGLALWRSDGTEAGTEPVVALPAGSDAGNEMVATDRQLFFTTWTEAGLELWRSDGTAAGTSPVTDPGSGAASAQRLFAFGGDILFAASHPRHGCAVWRSDGEIAGTVVVSAIEPNRNPCPPPVEGGIEWVPDFRLAAGGVVYFAQTHSRFGLEPWISDGTTAGTHLLADINPVSPGCPGDCDGNRVVTIAELIRGVGIALGASAMDGCAPLDIDADGVVRIDELVAAVGAALAGCG